MSKRAEERALEAYPPETRKAFELLPKDWNKPLRTAYVKGYEQAEKDLKDELIKWATDAYVYENASAIRKVCYKQLLEKLMEL